MSIYTIIFFSLLQFDNQLQEDNVRKAVDSCFMYTSDNFNPWICVSMAFHESRFRPESVGPELKSGNKALGMLQVLTHYHKVQEPVDVHTFRGSVIYGSLAFDYWYNRKGNVEKALCHYAGGNKCADNYSKKVLQTTGWIILDTL